MSGGATFFTFDGNLYYGMVTFCEMILAQDGCSNSVPGNMKTFRVTMKNFDCNELNSLTRPLSVCRLELKVTLDVSFCYTIFITGSANCVPKGCEHISSKPRPGLLICRVYFLHVTLLTFHNRFQYVFINTM